MAKLPTQQDRWNPPRGAVRIAADHRRTGSWAATCSTCDWSYPSPQYSSTRTGAEEEKRYHKCPAGTLGAFPTCPECSSTTKHCKTPAGSALHGPTNWHQARTDAWIAALQDDQQ